MTDSPAKDPLPGVAAGFLAQGRRILDVVGGFESVRAGGEVNRGSAGLGLQSPDMWVGLGGVGKAGSQC